MKKIGLAVLFILLSNAACSLTLPLSYELAHGAYSLVVKFANHKSLLLMLDTGSSNLNVVGDKQLCPACQLLIHGTRFTPDDPITALEEEFFMQYGLGDGKLKAYQGGVQAHDQLALDQFKFGVYEQGQAINNIVGFAYPDAAAPRRQPMPAFFTELNRMYSFQDQFSLLLCDVRAPSKLFLGPLPEKLRRRAHHSVPIIHQSLYFIQNFGVSAPGGKMLIDLPMGYDAIVDSGTSAKLVFPDRLLAPLVAYLKQHTSKKNQALPKEFWNGTTCVATELIDPKAFPELFFHFKDAKGKAFQLKLPASRYITSSACGAGYYKLGFIGYEAHKNDAKTQDHKKSFPNFIILGTPFLEAYMTTFHQDHPAELRFYNSQELCNPAYQAKLDLTGAAAPPASAQ